MLHSVALRRLAARTQVVGVGESDFPRTRLTHSLECAQIGRELAVALGADADLVDTACLAHDLGHPPFGHNGEAALAEFAERIGGFEGNAQSLRVLTRLEAKVTAPDGTSAGLNLTRATLDAATKYPWPRRVDHPEVRGVRRRPTGLRLVPGRASSGRRDASRPRSWTGPTTSPTRSTTSRTGSRPATYRWSGSAVPRERAELVELARESYLEVPAEELAEALDRLRAEPFWLPDFDGSMRAMVALKRMTSELIGRLCGAATRATRERAGGAPLRRYSGDVIVPAQTRAECAVLKAIADRYVMRREVTVRAQRLQREQLTELLAALAESAPGTLEPWLRTAYDAAPDDDARLRVVVDQVASLTDTSALTWHDRHVSGVRR